MDVKIDLSEVSKRLEVDPKAICVLAKAGLISPEMDESGYMTFSEVEVARVSVLLSLKNDWGYSVSTLKNCVFERAHHRTCELTQRM